jgi:hypothetical protein
MPVAPALDVRELGAAMGSQDSRFRTTLIRVLVVQAVALTLLGLLQLVYNR